ncbi:toprim domain-containing protein, partial [Plebeiibacterium sediminum]
VDSFWVSNYSKTHKTLVVSENPIDNLSYCQIHGDFTSTHVASFGTISDKQCQKLFNLVDQGIYKSIILINDNDFGGLKNDLKIIMKFANNMSPKIIKIDTNLVELVIDNEEYLIKDKDTFKWFLNKLVNSNDIKYDIKLIKCNSKDWNDELLNL